jgi:hypothetical protein
MDVKTMFRRACIAAFVATSVASAAAQPPAPLARREARVSAQTAPAAAVKPGVPAPSADDPDALSDAQLATMLDTYAMFQAQQQLSIGDERFGTFAGRLKKLQDTRRRNQRQRLRIVQELRQLAGPKAAPALDDAAIRAALTALKEHDVRAAAELRAAYDALDEILDPRQQARYRILEEQIERRKLDLILRAQERARQKKQQR